MSTGAQSTQKHCAFVVIQKLICPLPKKHMRDTKDNNANNKMENKHKNLIFPFSLLIANPKLEILFWKHKTIYKYL